MVLVKSLRYPFNPLYSSHFVTLIVPMSNLNLHSGYAAGPPICCHRVDNRDPAVDIHVAIWL
jgi:hypothetical protein